MLTPLTWISFALAAVYVLVLAVTLILVARHLIRANRLAQALAAGLETVDAQTRRLRDDLAAINGALGELRGGLQAVDGHYANIVRRAGLE